MIKVKHGDEMKRLILETGVQLWQKDPTRVTSRNIAGEIGITHAGIIYHFKGNLRDAVAKYAVEIGNSHVIVQLLASRHKAVKKMSKEERARHLAVI